jgi:hypothetical protein
MFELTESACEFLNKVVEREKGPNEEQLYVRVMMGIG